MPKGVDAYVEGYSTVLAMVRCGLHNVLPSRRFLGGGHAAANTSPNRSLVCFPFILAVWISLDRFTPLGKTQCSGSFREGDNNSC